MGQEQKESNRRHSGTEPVVTAPLVGRGEWGRALEPPRSVPAVSGQPARLTGATVGEESSLDHRCNAPFSRPVASTAVSSRVENS